MGRAYSTLNIDKKWIEHFWLETLKENDYEEEQKVDERTIIK
jgi:hypothetical protein